MRLSRRFENDCSKWPSINQPWKLYFFFQKIWSEIHRVKKILINNKRNEPRSERKRKNKQFLPFIEEPFVKQVNGKKWTGFLFFCGGKIHGIWQKRWNKQVWNPLWIFHWVKYFFIYFFFRFNKHGRIKKNRKGWESKVNLFTVN